MTSNEELKGLIKKAESLGAHVDVEYDMLAMGCEGRALIVSVQVTGLSGIGPFPMPALAAAERLRSLSV